MPLDGTAVALGTWAVVHELDDETEPPNVMLAGVGWGEYRSGEKGLSRQEMAATPASSLDGLESAGCAPELSGFDDDNGEVVGHRSAVGPYAVGATDDNTEAHIGTVGAGVTAV